MKSLTNDFITEKCVQNSVAFHIWFTYSSYKAFIIFKKYRQNKEIIFVSQKNSADDAKMCE